MPQSWSNWSGSVTCEPRRTASPATEAEIQDAVRAAATHGESVRVTGTGHSFTPLCATDGTLLNLDGWTGIESHDLARGLVTVRAGTKLREMGALLFDLGVATRNLGDVDVQSIAGATGTGTHGTGHTLGNLSSYIAALRLVTADGGLLHLSEQSHPDLLRAARVSLGMLGVVSAITLRVVPAFRLHERVWPEPFDEVMARLDERIAENVRYEFFWFPATDMAECKSLNPTDQPADEAGGALAVGTPAAASLTTMRSPAERERVGWSATIIPSVRERRFNELEFAVPAAAGPDCFGAVRKRMRERHPEVLWPVEYRTLAADDAWLSPAHGRDTVTISIHQDARLPYQAFFADIESIMVAHAGRPHWGKIHTRSAAELRPLYPRWDQFQEVRQQFDPAGRFLNPHLRAVFGIDR